MPTSWLKSLRNFVFNLKPLNTPVKKVCKRSACLSVEGLEERAVPAITISGLDTVTGEVTFTGDGSADLLILSDNGAGLLQHNVVGGGLNSSIDLDPGTAGDQTMTIGNGTARNITVSLGGGDDTLVLDNSWNFNHLITYDGGATTENNTLQSNDTTGVNWVITGLATYSGGITAGTDNLSFTNVQTFAAGSGNDTLAGENAARTWTLDAALTYSDGTDTITFSGFEVLQGDGAADTFDVTGAQSNPVTLNGGLGDDTFSFADSVSLDAASKLDGEGGTDTLDFSAFATIGFTVELTGVGSTDGFTGSEIMIGSATFDNIDDLTGSAATPDDMLIGQNAAAVFTVQAGNDTYVSGGNTLTFNDVDLLTGGNDADTFNMNVSFTGLLSGNDGDDDFNFASGVVFTGEAHGGANNDEFNFTGTASIAAGGPFLLTGSIHGNAGTDKLDYSGRGVGVTVTTTGDTTEGYDGSGTDIAGGFTGINILVGSIVTDTLINDTNAAGLFTVNGSNTFSFTGNVSGDLAFSAMENLTGDDGPNDVFNVSVNHTGNLTGQDGDDDFNLSAGTLTGNVSGGLGADEINISGTGAVTGNVSGGGGADELDYTGFTTSTVSVTATGDAADGYAGTATAISAGFSGINSVIGRAATTDTLINDTNAAGLFTVNGTNTFSFTGNTSGDLSFAAMDNLTGDDSVTDQFLISVSHTGNLTGNSGDDVFSFTTGVTLTGNVDGNDGLDQVTLNGTAQVVGNVNGGNQNDTITLNGTSAVDGNVDGGATDDTLILNGDVTGTRITGTFIGNTGSDTLSYAGATTVPVGGVLADLDPTGTASGIATAFTDSIENFIGSNSQDTISVNALAGGVTRNIEGNDPTANPNGDILNVDASGQTPTFGPGFISFTGGFGTITYTEIENINLTTTGDIVVTGDGNANTLILNNVTDFNDGNFMLDAGPIINFTDCTTFTFNAQAGDDSFVINNRAGGMFAPVNGVRYDGGANTDSLRMTGSTLAGTGTYSVGVSTVYGGGADQGTVVVIKGGDNQNLQFDNLENPIDDEVAISAFIVNATDAADTISAINPAANEGQVAVTGFVAWTFINKDNVSVNGGNGTAGGDAADAITVNFSSLPTGMTAFTINADEGGDTIDLNSTAGGAAYQMNGGDGDDVFNVNATVSADLNGQANDDNFFFDATTTLTGTVSGGTGVDTFNFDGGSVAGSVSGDAGADVFDVDASGSVSGGASGGTEADTFEFDAGTLTASVTGDDQNDIFNFDGGSVTGSVSGNADDDDFNFTAAATVTGGVSGGAGADEFNFNNNAAALTGSISGVDGADELDYTGRSNAVTITVGNPSNNTNGYHGFASAISGSFDGINSVIGGSGSDTLRGAQRLSTWTLGATSAYNDGGATNLTFSAFESLVGGAASDTFNVNDGVTFTGTVDGGTGTDNLSYAAFTSAATFNLNGTNGGTASSIGTFLSMENLSGGTVNDGFVFANGARVTGQINGGGGTNNSLDYSAYTTAVRVDLGAGTADGAGAGLVGTFRTVTGGSAADSFFGAGGDDTLNGGGGNDIIVGNGGADSILGGAGYDILLGGAGVDNIDGGSEDDIVVGGTTSYDANLAALTKIMSEWSRTTVPFATRVARVTGAATGGLNGTFVFRKAGTPTVVDDGVADNLTGGTGNDLAVIFGADSVSGFEATL